MSELIMNALLNTPTCALDAFAHNEQLTFVIDLGTEPSALAQLYQVGQPFEPTLLLKDSTFDARAWQGPFSFSTEPQSPLALKAAALCLEKRCGMAILAHDEAQVLAHVRTLLKVNDGCGGQSYLSLGRPYLWAALALTAGPRAPRLFGPVDHVLTPAPMNLQLSENPWYLWSAPEGQRRIEGGGSYDLPPEFTVAARTLRLLYFLDADYASFGAQGVSQVTVALANLELLIDHGVSFIEHLIRLASQINGPLLANNPQAMAILSGDEMGFVKAKRLAQLAEYPNESASPITEIEAL